MKFQFVKDIPGYTTLLITVLIWVVLLAFTLFERIYKFDLSGMLFYSLVPLVLLLISSFSKNKKTRMAVLIIDVLVLIFLLTSYFSLNRTGYFIT